MSNPITEQTVITPLKTNQGHILSIDYEDLERLSKFTWLYYDGSVSRIYHSAFNGKRLTLHVPLANEVLQIERGILVDHKDNNPFNNQKSNLRISDRYQNAQNRRKRLDYLHSQYKGVDRKRGTSKYRCRITFKGKTIYIGSFKTEQEAALAYNKKAKELFGEFANLNIL